MVGFMSGINFLTIGGWRNRMRVPLSLILTATVAILGCLQAKAETVYVKYRGPVSLERFSCNETVSSVVHRVCYRADRQYLVVLLGDTYYHYCLIPSGVIGQWLAAPSLGRFYNANIKSNYDCRLGGIPSD